MKAYLQDIEQVFKELKTDLAGLSRHEANTRRQLHGTNSLKEAPKPHLLKRLWQQINDAMVLILLAAALISAAFGEYTDTLIIMLVVVINAILGLVQEGRAEKAIEALRGLTAPQAHVLREGQLFKIAASELVIGDIVELNSGDAVPADLRLIESHNLRSDEASLSGESLPIDKISSRLKSDYPDIPLGDRFNMAYAGTNIVYGRGKGVVVAIGMDTEIGKIAASLNQNASPKTPLQKRLGELSRFLSIAVLAICAFIFAFSLWQNGDFSATSLLNTFMLAISLAVAAIPEGLVVVVTIALSIAMANMSRKKAIIRQMTAVETLGCTRIICSDKTGTLTQNKMNIVHQQGHLPSLIKIAALCNDAILGDNQNISGEPTEVALSEFAYQNGFNRLLKHKMPRIGELPFASERKMMSTLHKLADGGYLQCSKGAPEVLLNKCSHYYDQDGQIKPLDEPMRGQIQEQVAALSAKAWRVLAAAEQNFANPQQFPAMQMNDYRLWEKDLIFCGLYAMLDPIRPEAKKAIAQAKAAGIETIMITGDHQATAAAIARQLNILSDDSQILSGRQLDLISDEELAKTIGRYKVYARVQPEHKMRIVAAWQQKGYVTAMTGDGVNDAPALKKADIGVGMGLSGSDVSNSVADMVLADDNYATIIQAISEGRRIYENIRKAIQFLLASNLSEVLAIFAATILGLRLFLPIHLLWINLITDSLPAIALSMEPAEKNMMNSPPRKAHSSIFADGMGLQILWQGLFCAILTLMSFMIGLSIDNITGTTMAFITLSAAEIFHSWNMRSRLSSVFSMSNNNPWLFAAMAVSLGLNFVILYTPLHAAFQLTPLPLYQLATALLLAILIIPLVEINKAWQRYQKK